MSLDAATAESLRNALKTVVVVPVTPFDADGNPDTGSYAQLATRLLDGGITVLTPNGNTGEFYALNQAEARLVVETAAKAAQGRAELLAGVGHDIATATDGGPARGRQRRHDDHDPPARASLPCRRKAGSTTTPHRERRP